MTDLVTWLRGTLAAPGVIDLSPISTSRGGQVRRPHERSDAEFVLGSAIPHGYDLVLGSHSVHTSTETLREAEARISVIQTRLMQQGRL